MYTVCLSSQRFGFSKVLVLVEQHSQGAFGNVLKGQMFVIVIVFHTLSFLGLSNSFTCSSNVTLSNKGKCNFSIIFHVMAPPNCFDQFIFEVGTVIIFKSMRFPFLPNSILIALEVLRV